MDFKKQNNLTNKMEKSFKDYDSDNNMTTQAIIVNTPEELQDLSMNYLKKEVVLKMVV